MLSASPTNTVLYRGPGLEITTKSIQTVGVRFPFQPSDTTELRKRAKTAVVWGGRMEKRALETVNGQSRGAETRRQPVCQPLNH